ncbi:hypothetical protein [Pseudobacteriovorax antillogorgiicola]|uniref:Ankyrin repeat n=1 Tax=Pseudobacteriovorax antillogorgiicola TaxID=1513793 RepID=A0A1Y6CS81_9BACT|nr:hypothetical protein [Pseudobacteriovorax antillogorgiicola]TCS46126.1 ankyrin repeat protein [Pseudobacteriovorax antillogorgiicola]SMF69583.1 Ankyrin repeat [Pseudobacteriovorax antillogorgiicola]
MKSLILVALLGVLLLDSQGLQAKAPFYQDTLRGLEGDGCHLLSRGPGIEVPKNPGLKLFIGELFDALKNQKWRDFSRFFHPRARVEKDFGDRVKAILDHRYQEPWQFSVYGVWAFLDGERKKDLYECPRASHMKLVSHSGYQKQYMVIFQLMSQNELGRLVFSIAPKPNKVLTVVGFHIQQWSHNGQDWVKWTEAGNRHLADKNQRSAYIYFDIAQKLLDGGTLAVYNYRQDIISARDKVFSQEEVVKAVQTDTNNPNIAYVGTILSRSDTGMLVRVEIEKEYNAEDLQKKCKTIGQSLVASGWLKDVNGGVNCSFIPKGANPKQDSKLGGYYLDRSKL